MWFKTTLLVLLLMIVDVSGKGSRGGGGRGSSGARSRGHSHSRGRPKFVKLSAKSGSIERTQLFRSAVFGATAGHLISQGTKHYVNSPSSPMIWSNRRYYWGSTYFVHTNELPTQCTNAIDPQDPQFGRVHFMNETRPREIVWGCPANNLCCGYECCSEGGLFDGILRLALLIFVVAICILFVWECLRWTLHCIYTLRNKEPPPIAV